MNKWPNIWHRGVNRKRIGALEPSMKSSDFAKIVYYRCHTKVSVPFMQCYPTLRDRHDWQELREGGKLIGLTKDGANISLEPGGALELSGAPLETIHETCDEVNIHLKEVKDIADEIGVGFIGLARRLLGCTNKCL
jgi:glutamate--cysteine ligase